MINLTIFPQHNKFLVTDQNNRTLYTIKRKWRGGYAILDQNHYELYVLSPGTQDRHPVYQIQLNGKKCGEYRCKSKFLEPSMLLELDSKTMQLRTDDGLSYTILVKKQPCGTITVVPLARGEYKFELQIEDAEFDDYIPLLPLAAVECIAPKEKEAQR